MSLGKMAHFVQQQKSGDAVYFVLNQKIEHTNICVLSCKFCDFAVKKGDAGAYEMTTEEILSQAHAGDPRGAHHRRDAGRLALGAVPRHRPRPSARQSPERRRQGVHRGGDRFLPQEIQDADRGGPPAAAGGRAQDDARRRRGGVLRARAAAPLQPEDRREGLVRRPRDGAPARHPDQQHDALRPHRDARGAARST